MPFKIHGGTANHSNSTLCSSCRHATIVKGRALRDEIIECSCLDDDTRITFAVTSCTQYSDRSRPSLYDMEDLAWILRTDKKTKTIGFVRPSELRRIPVVESDD